MRRLLSDRSGAATREFAVGAGAMALAAAIIANLIAAALPPVVDPDVTGSIPERPAAARGADGRETPRGDIETRAAPRDAAPFWRGWLPIVK